MFASAPQQGLLVESTETLQDTLERNRVPYLLDNKRDIINGTLSLRRFQNEVGLSAATRCPPQPNPPTGGTFPALDGPASGAR